MLLTALSQGSVSERSLTHAIGQLAAATSGQHEEELLFFFFLFLKVKCHLALTLDIVAVEHIFS